MAKKFLILLFCLPVWGARLPIRLLNLQSCNLGSMHTCGGEAILQSCHLAPLAALPPLAPLEPTGPLAPLAPFEPFMEFRAFRVCGFAV